MELGLCYWHSYHFRDVFIGLRLLAALSGEEGDQGTTDAGI